MTVFLSSWNFIVLEQGHDSPSCRRRLASIPTGVDIGAGRRAIGGRKLIDRYRPKIRRSVPVRSSLLADVRYVCQHRSMNTVGTEEGVTDKAQGLGCAVSMIGLNILLMGLLASTFARGPYLSWGQEVWYRYGSLGFLLFGAVLPAVVLTLGAGRSRSLIIALTVWMLGALFFCFAYALNSGGGV